MAIACQLPSIERASGRAVGRHNQALDWTVKSGAKHFMTQRRRCVCCVNTSAFTVSPLTLALALATTAITASNNKAGQLLANKNSNSYKKATTKIIETYTLIYAFLLLNCYALLFSNSYKHIYNRLSLKITTTATNVSFLHTYCITYINKT